MGILLQIYQFQKFLNLNSGLLSGQLLDLRHIPQKTTGGEIRVHPLLLGHIAKQPSEGFSLLQDIRPLPQNFSGGSFDIIGNQVHQRAFPCTVGTQYTVNARSEGIGKPIQGCLIAVAFGQAIHPKLHSTPP